VVRRLRPLTLVSLPLLLAGCHGRAPSALRPPTAPERAEIVVSVEETWRYESRPPESLPFYYHVHLRRPKLRPRVVAVRVSRADPRYASVLVELRHRRGRQRGATAVLVLKQDRTSKHGWGYPIAGPALSFPLSCTAATPKALRDLLCPDPWSRLGYPRPRLRAQTALTQPIRTSDLHALDWRTVTLPGGACGSTRPIRPLRYEYGPAALIQADVGLPWWNPVVVASWSKPVFGDLDGDGRDEAALDLVCTNGGGTAGGQLAFSQVIFKAVGRSLQVVGILTPRQPLEPDTQHVPLSSVVAIQPGKMVVSEAWYGPYDGDCCASGRARTIWTYDAGKLRPTRTRILRKPWSSPLILEPVVAEPGDQELHPDKRTRVVASNGLRFAVVIDNLGQVTKRHVKVTLRIGQSPSPIVEARTIGRIRDQARLLFGRLGRLRLGVKTIVTVDVADPGAFPVGYPVVFMRG
jgi:hypothetical protein